MTKIIFIDQLIIPIGSMPVINSTCNLVQIGICIQNIWFACYKIMFDIAIIRDSRLTRLPLFGRYQDYTICTTRTIDSCSRTIFQYGNGLDIRLCQITQISSRHTINHNQRTVTSLQRRSSTHLNTTTLIRVSSGNTINHDSGYFSIHHLHRIIHGTSQKIFATYTRNCRSQILLHRRTITDHHYFLQVLCVFLQCNIKGCLTFYRHFQCLKTDIRDLQYSIIRYIFNSKCTVHIGNVTDRCSFDDHIGTNNRVSKIIDHSTRQSPTLLYNHHFTIQYRNSKCGINRKSRH